jgi:hypothetical protein
VRAFSWKLPGGLLDEIALAWMLPALAAMVRASPPEEREHDEDPFRCPPGAGLACGGAATEADHGRATKLGLKMDAPAGTTVSDGIMGGVMVQGPNLLITSTRRPTRARRTAEDAALEVDMYNPQEAKSEKLADGFAFTFVNTRRCRQATTLCRSAASSVASRTGARRR